MKPWVLVSYYTRGTGYEVEVKKLTASCDRLGIKYTARPVPSRGSWQKNTQMKAEVILSTLRACSPSAVVFVDADAIVHQYPALFDTLDADLGLSFRDYALFPCGSRKSGRELLSGTIYLANNEAVRGLVGEWVAENGKNPGVWEQKNLQAVVGRWDGRLRVAELPPTYCKIFDLMRSAGPAVIEHYQKSRVYRGQTSRLRPAALRGVKPEGMIQSRDVR